MKPEHKFPFLFSHLCKLAILLLVLLQQCQHKRNYDQAKSLHTIHLSKKMLQHTIFRKEIKIVLVIIIIITKQKFPTFYGNWTVHG